MKIAFAILIALVGLPGCADNPPAQQSRGAPAPAESTAPPQMDAVEFGKLVSHAEMAAEKRREDREAKLFADIKRDKQGTLLPPAKEYFTETMQQAIGNAAFARGTVTTGAIEDFGKRHWQVKGTYHGPDQDGRIFTSQWMVELEANENGILKSSNIDLGKPKYEE